MIIQYLIDWECVGQRINDFKNTDGLECLFLRLHGMREKIENNGVLIDSNNNVIVGILQSVVELTDVFMGMAEECELERLNDIKNELECFQNLYENKRVDVQDDYPENGSEPENDPENALRVCMRQWSQHIHKVCRRISTHCAVVITESSSLDVDKSDVFVKETLDSYNKSAIEELRKRWNDHQSFNQENKKEFISYLGVYAATSNGQVSFFDPYWSKIGHPYNQGNYACSTRCLLEPFIKNPYVRTIDFVSKYQSEPRSKQECFCVANIEETLKSWIAVRPGPLTINIVLLDEKKDPQAKSIFHNRYIVNDLYRVSLPNGMDVCSHQNQMREFQMQRAGSTDCPNANNITSLLRRGEIKGFEKHRFKSQEVDFCAPPYERILRDNPSVRLTLDDIA